MTDIGNEDNRITSETEDEGKKPAEVWSEKAEDKSPELTDKQMRAAVLAYARYLREKGLEPGDATFVEPEDLGVDIESPAEEEPAAEAEPEEAPAAEEKTEKKPEEKKPEGKKKKPKKESSSRDEKKKQARIKRKSSYTKKFLEKGGKEPLAALTDVHDKVQDGIDGAAASVAKGVVTWGHKVSTSYTNSRRGIGVTLLIIALLAAGILIIFDKFTVYEYAYNGKVLGYVQEQEEVTEILDVAGTKLSSNNGGAGVEFVANQNITFNLVDARGKSTDDADTAVNKLIYMTDIEVEAFAVYDGAKAVAIVKSSEDAENLLNQTKEALSTPDKGMTLVSSEFTNPLDIRPVNVLLSSVQSNEAAQKQMIKGGDMETFHIVEDGETAESIAAEFGVETIDIYDEDNEAPVEEMETGDRVCIRSSVDPVSVKMVEEGRLKEVIEYKTIKEESDEYYKGDTYVKQEGVDQVQIFEGRITKIAGEVTDRKETADPEIIKKGQDKIILVGTAERPKTAPTGTFAMPIKSYVVTSEFGGRWGRMHTGMDLGASTGTPIYATDGGKVIRASYYSGYGLCVDIDHGNNTVSRYAHCSRVLVSAGDMVYQGQEIAKVGNTGNSFGSHLHFEVIINGTAQNPRKFITP